MRIKIIGLLVFLLTMSALEAQNIKRRPPSDENERLGRPMFFYEIGTYPTVNRDSVKVTVKTKVPFDVIQFIKTDDMYTAEYELSIIIIDEEEDKQASIITSQNLETELFDETNSQNLFDINEFSFYLLPDKYTVIISLMDKDTRKKNIQREKIDIAGFYEKSISLSNINIVEQEFTNKKGDTDRINAVGSSIDDSQPKFSISFVILSDGGPADITYTIFSIEGKKIKSETFNDTLKNGITNRYYQIDRNDLTYSKYKIQVKVDYSNDTVTRERVFQLRWLGMSRLIDDLDMAIEQIKYIASGRELRKMKKADEKEKKEKFIAFWKHMDPTPETDENELMNEYYKRVRYANKNFSGFMEGWKTDMGMIFILFGPPSDIERHPYEAGTKPFEIWYYYEIDRRFIFVDETGFGDYRLTEPYFDNTLYY